MYTFRRVKASFQWTQNATQAATQKVKPHCLYGTVSNGTQSDLQDAAAKVEQCSTFAAAAASCGSLCVSFETVPYKQCGSTFCVAACVHWKLALKETNSLNGTRFSGTLQLLIKTFSLDQQKCRKVVFLVQSVPLKKKW